MAYPSWLPATIKASFLFLFISFHLSILAQNKYTISGTIKDKHSGKISSVKISYNRNIQNLHLLSNSTASTPTDL